MTLILRRIYTKQLTEIISSHKKEKFCGSRNSQLESENYIVTLTSVHTYENWRFDTRILKYLFI